MGLLCGNSIRRSPENGKVSHLMAYWLRYQGDPPPNLRAIRPARPTTSRFYPLSKGCSRERITFLMRFIPLQKPFS